MCAHRVYHERACVCVFSEKKKQFSIVKLKYIKIQLFNALVVIIRRLFAIMNYITRLTLKFLEVGLVFTCLSILTPVVKSSHNGGSNCAACSIVTGMLHQHAISQNLTGSQAFDHLCELQPGLLKTLCHLAQNQFSESFDLDKLTELDDEYTPDEYCLARGFCTSEHQPVCYLFPKPVGVENLQNRFKTLQKLIHNSFGHSDSFYDNFCGFDDYSKQFCNVFIKAFGGFFGEVGLEAVKSVQIDWELLYALEPKSTRRESDIESFEDLQADHPVVDHLPEIDHDEDRFGGESRLGGGLRGYHWRGFDCDDSRVGNKAKNVYPGRNPELNNWDSSSDSNCNGIFGKDKNTGLEFEKSYCEDYPGTGVIALGDSATAHFHLPRKVFMGGEWDVESFADLFTLVKNEGDWPMLSWGTGYDAVEKYSLFEIDFKSSLENEF